jgi:hypothetical protein
MWSTIGALRNCRARVRTHISVIGVIALWTVSVRRLIFAITDQELVIQTSINRRRFLRACSGTALALLIPRKESFAGSDLPHPTPRLGVSGEHVLNKEELAQTPKLIPLFDSVRKIPEVMDGIRCNCGCTEPPLLRSLLSCFEAKGMARTCAICQGQARLAVRLHKEGKSLDQIRAAIDAKYR